MQDRATAPSGPLRALAAPWVLPGEGPAIRDGAVVLDADDRIVAVGPEAALRVQCDSASAGAPPAAALQAGLEWTRHDAVLTPGLVNAHVHLELSALRGEVPGGAGFVPWVRHMLAARKRLMPESDTEAIEVGVSELLRAGSVAVGEVSNSLASIRPLAGLSLVGRVFHEVFGISTVGARDALEQARPARDALEPWPENLSYALAPHTPYT
jgi:cytosine/adenosine deaminase-related metal-dependent hydrolase